MASEDAPMSDLNGITISANKVIKKRNRLPLSCEACRLRKSVVRESILTELTGGCGLVLFYHYTCLAASLVTYIDSISD